MLRLIPFFCVLTILSALPNHSAEAADPAGRVAKLKGDAFVTWGSGRRELDVGAAIISSDVIETGADSRLELLMVDGAVLTLGEQAVFNIEDYVFDKSAKQGSAVMTVVEGAFRAVSGALASVPGQPFTVHTPVATIGIRGTDFWGGPIDGVYNSALLGGAAIFVENGAGRVEINNVGYGTTITSPNIAPTLPVLWDPTKMQRATDATNF